MTVADLGPLAGRLRVGDSVDVYASFVHDGKRNAAPVLLAARSVRRAPADDGAPDTANAMLAVRPEDALRFVAARQGGILTAMLRHRDDAVAGRRGSGRSGRLAGHARRTSGGRRCHPLRRPADGRRRAVRATDTACWVAWRAFRRRPSWWNWRWGKPGAVPPVAARGDRQRQVLRAADADGQEIVIFGRAEGESSVHV